MTNSCVALLGPGKMGEPMGGHLIDGGHHLTVWARRPVSAESLVARGAVFEPVPRVIAENCEVIVDMLQDLSQLEPLLEGPNGLLAGVSAPTVLVVSSSVAPQDIRALATRAETATAGLLQVVDAPVSGGQAGAQAGTLSIMVGGSKEPAEKAIGVLQSCGNPVLCGPLGAGEVVKACNQLVVGITMAGLAEAALLAEGAGVDVSLMYSMLSHGWGASAVLDAKHTKIEQHDYSNTGAAKFMVKDLRIALSEAEESGKRMPISSAALRIYEELTAAGLGDEDLAVIHKYLGEQDVL